MNRKTLVAALLDPDPFVPGHGMADTGLRLRRCDHDRVAERTSCGEQRLEARSVNPIVVGDEQIHSSSYGRQSQRRRDNWLILISDSFRELRVMDKRAGRFIAWFPIRYVTSGCQVVEGLSTM